MGGLGQRHNSSGKNLKIYLKRGGIPGLFFVYFRLFLQDTIQIEIDKSVDGVLGIRTRMEGADEST